ncbi:MAG: hypothetical protein SGCHY_000082 [Lobulomycetales sp.]
MAVEQESPLEFWRSEYQRAYGAPFVKVSAKLQTALRSAAKPVQQPIAETVQPAVEVQRPPSRQTAAPQLQVVAASVDEASQVPEPNPVSVASESVPHHRDNTQKAKASKAGKTKRDIYNYGVGNTRPANYGNYMKTFNIGAPKSQVMPYTSTRAARLKDFERKHATSDLPAVERYRHALSILDKVSNRYQSEYSRMNEWRTFMSQKEATKENQQPKTPAPATNRATTGRQTTLSRVAAHPAEPRSTRTVANAWTPTESKRTVDQASSPVEVQKVDTASSPSIPVVPTVDEASQSPGSETLDTMSAAQQSILSEPDYTSTSIQTVPKETAQASTSPTNPAPPTGRRFSLNDVYDFLEPAGVASRELNSHFYEKRHYDIEKDSLQKNLDNEDVQESGIFHGKRDGKKRRDRAREILNILARQQLPPV